MTTSTSPAPAALSTMLPGTWRLLSRVDRTAAGDIRPEPSLGEDPVALLIYDRAGHFAAQFMRRDRSAVAPEGSTAARSDGRAPGGFDAYFGTYALDDATGVVTQTLRGALSREQVGAVITRVLDVQGDRLTITLDATALDGAPVTRTLIWQRVG